MKFKGRLVFVETDDRGEMVIDKGRASMKYRLEDDRVYHPWPSNITEPDADRTIGEQAHGYAGTPAASSSSRASARSEVRGEGARGVVAYTDGACIGNPGKAGLGYLVTWPDGRRVQKGEPLGQGTNNIAELTAILRVLELVDDEPGPVAIYTDSEYAIGVLQRNWKAKANQELIRTIKQRLARLAQVELRKVPGHAGIAENELVDDLARLAAQDQREVDRA